VTRRLVVTFFALTAVALALLAIPLGITFANHERDRLLFDIETDADTMATRLHLPENLTGRVLAPEISQYAVDTGGTVIVVDRNGRALVDTAHPSEARRAYTTRPEIRSALAGRREVGNRRSETAGTTLVYAAVPVSDDGKVTGALRITFPTATLDERVRHVWGQVALLCVGVLIVVTIAGFVIARSVTKPVRQLEAATERFADGDLGVRVDEQQGPPELRHLASSFNRMAARIEQLVSAQQRFVADASHQLRTPLTALRLRLENLEACVDRNQRGAVVAATAEVARLSRLVDGLLLLARDEGAEQRVHAVDLVPIIRERCDIWSEVGRERNVRVDVDMPPTANAYALAGAVEQIVDNLVDNALGVAPDGSTITLSLRSDARDAVLHVVDEGPGLDAAARERAFNRFWRASNAPPGGSGLGLAIVRGLAEAAGGSVVLDAAPTGGIDAVVRFLAAPAGDRSLPEHAPVS
jgi:signal transduction histidine kinase